MMLYRFVDLGTFVEIAATGRMFLRQVTAWDDPYELDAISHLLSHLLEKTHLAVRDPSRTVSPKAAQLRTAIRKAILKQATRSIYAQSWTTKPESDALWRIYSPDRKGLRLSVELDTLLKEMTRTLPNVDHFSVEYCSTEEARHRLLSRFNESKSMNFTSCCRYKRREFEHEQEYRFCLAQNPEGFQEIDLRSPAFDLDSEESLEKALAQFHEYHFDQVRYYQFEPSHVHEITLDPRLDPNGWFEKAIGRLCETYGISLVRRSNLYTRTG